MIKAYIFDLDGTLYPRDSNLFRAMSLLLAEWFKNRLAIKSDFEKFYEQMKIEFPSPLEAIQSLGLSISSYHQEVFDEINIKYYALENKGVESILDALVGEKFIVTLSSRNHTDKVLRSLGVTNYFSEIYNPGVNWFTNYKNDAYEAIRKKLRLLPKEICVIGDNYIIDLEEAKNMGYNCILLAEKNQYPVSTINTLKQIVDTVSTINKKQKEENSFMNQKISSIIQSAFARTTEEIISPEEWRMLLESGRQLRIKYGVDVTAPYLHIGHAVNLWMMRLLQDHGHKVIFLIGDFTTQIGDPTGKSKTRPVISRKEIENNMQKFIEQAKMILRFDDPELLEIRYNSEWFEKMPTAEFLNILSKVTHGRLISRDMFQKRLSNQDDIYMHELVYPVFQGYDSFMLKTDLTIIGTDQLFNEMMGRFYQERFGQAAQVIITTKITPGIDGGAKQSKSLDNYIGLGHSPRDKFGRIMRIPDNLIMMYFEVYTSVLEDDLKSLGGLVQSNPLEAKKQLATEIVRRYHGDEVARMERDWFDRTFSQRQIPADIPILDVDSDTVTVLDILHKFFDNQKSKSEIRRLIEQGAVSCNNVKIIDPAQQLALGESDVFQVGKRTWFKIHLL